MVELSGYIHLLLDAEYCGVQYGSGLEVIKLEYKLRLTIKRNDWLLADTCPQTANHCALFWLII